MAEDGGKDREKRSKIKGLGLKQLLKVWDGTGRRPLSDGVG